MIMEMDKEITPDEVDEAQTQDGEMMAEAAEEVPGEVTDGTSQKDLEEIVEDFPSATADEAPVKDSEDLSEGILGELVEEALPETSEESEGDGEEGDEIEAITIEDEAESAEEVTFDDGRAWYVVHCYSGYENKVRHSIEQRIETMGMQDKIFDVVVPTEEEIEIKDGKRRTVERRVFPGYILVQLIMGEDSWYVVRNTPGVTGFVGMGNEPTPLREDEVAKIMNRMEAEAPKVKFNFQPGEKVRIRTGPFADFIGTVDEIDIERAKVRVLVSFFGRETPVELDFLHVENV